MKVTIDLDEALATIRNSIDVQMASVKTAFVLLDGNGAITLLDGDAKTRLLDKAARNIAQALIVYDLEEDDADEKKCIRLQKCGGCSSDAEHYDKLHASATGTAPTADH